MSIKKTWFSYILWLFATGFSVLFTYYTVANFVKSYGIFGHDHIGFVIGYSIGVMVVVLLLCLMLRKLCNIIPVLKVNKWVARCMYILAFVAITVLFLYTRYYGFLSGKLNGNQMVCFYEMTRIGFTPEDLETLKQVLGNVSLVPSAFESIYMKLLSMLFLFLGNKLEVIILIQFFFHVLSLLCLYLIGWRLQKGAVAWIPALIYAGSPVYASMIGNFGPSNFWLCICLLGIVLILLLQKLWKKRFITYILISLWGICICALVFATKFAVLFQNGLAFLVGSSFTVTVAVLYTEFLIWAVVLFMYCVTFWFVKTDEVSLYVAPAVLTATLLLVLQYHECDVVFFLTMLSGFWISLLGMESFRLLFSIRPKVLTGQNTAPFVEKTVGTDEHAETNDFTWEEMQSIMEQKEEKTDLTEENSKLSEDHNSDDIMEDEVSEDTGVIRVSDILKAVGVEENISAAEEASASEESIDKTALIENVLPMPKKHVTRSFEYAFEPTEELMHYDVEVENDDYDYE